jgi:hypothetical protein
MYVFLYEISYNINTISPGTRTRTRVRFKRLPKRDEGGVVATGRKQSKIPQISAKIHT